MSRISRNALATAVRKVRAMDLAQHERLVDELFAAQPHVLASFLVQKKLGVSLSKMNFLIEIMLICFQAMKESGLIWPQISEDEQERQMSRFSSSVALGEGLPSDLRAQAMRQYIDGHPEKDLLAFVNDETVHWLQRVDPEESDKFVMIVALNFVNCIAFVPLPLPPQSGTSRKSQRKR